MGGPVGESADGPLPRSGVFPGGVRVEERRQDFRRLGLAAYRSGNPEEALRRFVLAQQQGANDPVTASYIGLLVGTVDRGRRQEGLAMCRRAMEVGVLSPVLYLNYAKALVLCHQRTKAVEALRQGLRVEPGNEQILEEINRLRPRGKGVVPMLDRSHPLNDWLGRRRRTKG